MPPLWILPIPCFPECLAAAGWSVLELLMLEENASKTEETIFHLQTLRLCGFSSKITFHVNLRIFV